jgi:peptide/nickel transport system ATP-binding protein/oligopeptide transport system ATP-binding protein
MSAVNLLEVKNLKVYFPVFGGLLRRQIGEIRAVDDISFTVPKGAAVGLVGESGSGKSTTGKAIIRLAPITAGSITFHGEEMTRLDSSEFLPIRKKIQMIFQDPFNSLNPRMTVGEIVSEPLGIHFPGMSPMKRKARVADLLDRVGLSPAHASRYPHQFSGGQRQRIGIARALAVEPEFIICDEPVSALDVSVQAQIVNLLQDLQEQLGLTYLFISHDLAVVEHLCETVLVMSNGALVETGPTSEVMTSPKHEYTQKLLAAVPTF